MFPRFLNSGLVFQLKICNNNRICSNSPGVEFHNDTLYSHKETLLNNRSGAQTMHRCGLNLF